MAKQSQINRNKKREKLVAQYAVRRAALKATADNMSVAPEDRFAARLKLATAARGSIAFGMSRLLTMSSLVTCAAFANAASVAALSPSAHV